MTGGDAEAPGAGGPPGTPERPLPSPGGAPGADETVTAAHPGPRSPEVEQAARTWKKTSSRVAATPPATPEGQAVAEAFRRATRRLADAPTAALRATETQEPSGSPGRVGRYELREALGSGGCGTVFKAWDARHERFVALKLIQRADAHARARFEREAKATARLKHAGIVPLIDSGEERGALYLVMELIDGSSLDRLADRRLLGQREAVAIVRDAARAIQVAHEAKILHRDLKPHNILVDREGHGHVTDFGLALADGSRDARLTATGSIVGTPAYMAPEQVGAGKLDARSDVYSLGATLFHALAGRPPFETGSIEELFLMILRTEPESPCRVDPTIPRDLGTICLKALDKDPARRYVTAAAFADELERWLAGEPIVARPPTGLERALRWSRRHALVASLCATTLALALALAAVLVHDALGR